MGLESGGLIPVGYRVSIFALNKLKKKIYKKIYIYIYNYTTTIANYIKPIEVLKNSLNFSLVLTNSVVAVPYNFHP